MTASHKQKSRICRKLMGKFSAIGGEDVRLEMDSLGRHYEVNRHGFRAFAPSSAAADALHQDVIAGLKVDGWAPVAKQYVGTLILAHADTGAKITIDKPFEHANRLEGWCIDARAI